MELKIIMLAVCKQGSGGQYWNLTESAVLLRLENAYVLQLLELGGFL